jgi:hypothetical protein
MKAIITEIAHLRAAAEYLEVGTSSFRDSLEEAIEAARVAKEESGK